TSPRSLLPLPISLSHPHSHPLHLHTSPTRRSSDLTAARALEQLSLELPGWSGIGVPLPEGHVIKPYTHLMTRIDAKAVDKLLGRSEEHTSELQSRENLVCRLLLEKKKYITIRYTLF